MLKTPIANGAEALIVSAREARTYYRSGVIPGGGQRVTVLCHVPANADLANVAETAGVLGKPDAQDATPLKGLARISLRERYMVRVERKNAKGAALAPRYKTPLAGTVVAVQSVKAPKAAAPATSAQSAPKTTSKASAAQSTTSKRGQGK
jgi:hypothetical protein